MLIVHAEFCRRRMGGDMAPSAGQHDHYDCRCLERILLSPELGTNPLKIFDMLFSQYAFVTVPHQRALNSFLTRTGLQVIRAT